MQMSNYRQLLLLSSKVLSTYDPDSNGVDTHLENFLQLPESSVSSSTCVCAHARRHAHTHTHTHAHTHTHTHTHTHAHTHTHTHTQDTYALKHLTLCIMSMQVKDEADTTFISEVFSGCVRYQGLIKVLHVCVFLADLTSSCPCSAVCGL